MTNWIIEFIPAIIIISSETIITTGAAFLLNPATHHSVIYHCHSITDRWESIISVAWTMGYDNRVQDNDKCTTWPYTVQEKGQPLQ